jgi:O-antigen/teichoic acid export membrane protein
MKLQKLTIALTRHLAVPLGSERAGSSNWSVAEHLAVPALQFASALPLVHGLGVDGFGHWVYLLGIATIVGALTPGFSMAATQQIAGEPCREKRSASAIISLGLGLLAVIIFSAIGATVFSFILESAPPQALLGLKGEITVYATLVALTGAAIQWDIICATALRAKLEFRTASVLEISSRTLSLSIVIVFVLNEGGIIGALWLNAALVFLKGLVKAAFIFKGESLPRFQTIAALAPRSIWFAILHWPQSFNSMVYMFADRVVIGYFAPASTVAVASLASQVASQLHAIPRAFLAPLVPALITVTRSGDQEVYRKVISSAISRLVSVQLILLPTILLFGTVLIYAIFRSTLPLVEISIIVICYSIGYIFLSTTIIPHFNLIGRQKVGAAAIIALLSALCNAILSIILGFTLGVYGVALAKSAYCKPYAVLWLGMPSSTGAAKK